jgi:hypothetical protein
LRFRAPLRIGDDKILPVSLENTSDNGISMGEEEHKLGIRASYYIGFL